MSESKETAAVAASIPHTSLDQYEQTEVTVRFNRWTAFEGTAYLRGQQAGFRRRQIDELERRGVVTIVHDRSRIAAAPVRKGAL